MATEPVDNPENDFELRLHSPLAPNLALQLFSPRRIPRHFVRRVEWALRTALAIILYALVSNQLKDYLDLAFFGAVVAAVVSNQTFGATLCSCVNVCAGTSLSTLICWLLLHTILPKGSKPTTATRCYLGGALFLLTLLGMLAKNASFRKFFLGMTVVFLLVPTTTTKSAAFPFRTTAGIVLGCIVTLIAYVLPFPRFAFMEAKELISKALRADALTLQYFVQAILADSPTAAEVMMFHADQSCTLLTSVIAQLKKLEAAMQWEPGMMVRADRCHSIIALIEKHLHHLADMRRAVVSLQRLSSTSSHEAMLHYFHTSLETLAEQVNCELLKIAKWETNGGDQVQPAEQLQPFWLQVEHALERFRRKVVWRSDEQHPTSSAAGLDSHLLPSPESDPLSPGPTVLPEPFQVLHGPDAAEIHSYLLPFYGFLFSLNRHLLCTVPPVKTHGHWKLSIVLSFAEFRAPLRVALAITLTSILVLVPNTFAGDPYTVWIPMTVCFLAEQHAGGIFRQSVLWLEGTSMAAMVSYVILMYANSVVWVYSILTAWVALCTYARSGARYGYSGNVAGYTAVLLTLGAPHNFDPAAISFSRVKFSAIGVVVLAVCENFIAPERACSMLTRSLVQAMHNSAKMCEAVIDGYLKKRASPEASCGPELWGAIAQQNVLLDEAQWEPQLTWAEFPTVAYTAILRAERGVVDCLWSIGVASEEFRVATGLVVDEMHTAFAPTFQLVKQFLLDDFSYLGELMSHSKKMVFESAIVEQLNKLDQSHKDYLSRLVLQKPFVETLHALVFNTLLWNLHELQTQMAELLRAVRQLEVLRQLNRAL